MDSLTRVLLTVLPFLLIIGLFVAMVPSLRRMRARDKTSPPSPRTMSLRMAPFAVILFAGGIWGFVAGKYELVFWGVVGAVFGGYSLFGYWRHEKRQES